MGSQLKAIGQNMDRIIPTDRQDELSRILDELAAASGFRHTKTFGFGRTEAACQFR